METYPLIKIPKRLKEIQTALPPMVEMPSKPSRPERKPEPAKPTREKAPPKPTLELSGSGGAWIVVGLGLLFIIVSISLKNPPIGSILIGMGFTIVGILIIYSTATSNNKKEDEYNQKLKQYPKSLSLFESGYKIELENYNRLLEKNEAEYLNMLKHYNEIEIPLYSKQLEIYDNQAKHIRSETSILTHRKAKLQEFLSDVTKPGIHPADKKIKKGVSEMSFFVKLKFPSLTPTEWSRSYHRNYTIHFSNTGKLYLPDITYYDPESGLCIDIEIDEPYIGSTGEPIHYSGSIDDERDNFFLNNGWIIIRFAEEQVANHPELCINMIKKVINEYTEFNNQSGNITGPKPIKRWTKEEAHKMAFKRVRNNYLKTTLIEKLEYENHEVPEEATSKIAQTKPHQISKPAPIKSFYSTDDDDNDLPF